MSRQRCDVRQSYEFRGGDWLILPFVSERQPLFSAGRLPSELRPFTAAPRERGSARTAYAGCVDGKQVTVRVVRLDAENVPVESQMRRLVAGVPELARKEEARRVVVALDAAPDSLVLAAHEGAVVGGYAFGRYLTKTEKRPPVTLVVPRSGARQRAATLAERSVVYECHAFARDLINEPPNVLNPPELARRFAAQGRVWGLKMEVWNDRRLVRERCGGIVGVGQGAKAKPRLVIGKYRPRGARAHLCLIGKGITFDTGGYGLKPAEYQIGMKYDMSGAAVTFAAACALARLRARINVTVIAPLAENDISGEAYHTTAVLTTRSGRTVEVEHTDAEGRLILADALTLAGELKPSPDWIVDAATLTGAAVVALGEDIAAVLGNDDGLIRNLIDLGRTEDELLWQLPLHMPYKELLKATIADCKNVGPRWGGAINGAVFLSQWVPAKTKWAHCDIAGPAGKEEALGHLGKGGKGFGVKTFVALGRKLAAG